MHETAIAKKLIEKAEQQGDVVRIKVEVGELAHVPAAEFIPCLKNLVSWKIDVTEKPASVECVCGFKGHPTILERGHDSFMIECPQCKSVPSLIDGKDIILQEVEVK